MIHFLRCFPGAMKSEKDTFVNMMNILELNTNANQFQISNKSVFGLLCFFGSPYHVITDGNFATCPILACTTSRNHWEMGKEVVDF